MRLRSIPAKSNKTRPDVVCGEGRWTKSTSTRNSLSSATTGILKIVRDPNDSYIKVVKMKGEFVWHRHAAEDELFYVVKGVLRIDFRDRQVPLGPGELLVVARGMEHRPVATEEVSSMMPGPEPNAAFSGSL